ncbi:MAG: transporter [Sphingomonadales bacterium]|nr:MAG: transporter [Sphingomonadales bacterium]
MRKCLAPIATLSVVLALVAAPAEAAAEGDATIPEDAEAATLVEEGELTSGETTLREFTTDRPDVTESPFTVDPGHFQIETTLFGHARSRADAAGIVTDTFEFGTTNLRLGLTDRLEVDFVWQPYGILDQRGGGVDERGIGSVTLRAKYNLWGNDGPARPGDTAVALLPYVTLPTDGNNGIGESEVAFGLIVPLAINLGGGMGLGLNGAANFTRSDVDPTYDAAVLTSASLAYEWNEVLGSYAEVVWEFSRNDPAGDIVTFNTGLTIGLGEDWQLDMGVNVGATRAADSIASFIGISARF